MELNLQGKSVIVTGGGSNIGRAISLAFAREGVHLTVAEIDEGQGREDRRRGPGPGRRLRHAGQDRRDATGKASRPWSRGRGARTAGWTCSSTTWAGPTTGSSWRRRARSGSKEVQLNLWGMINCTRAVLDGMIARKAGAIVSMGSDAGRMGEFREARVRRVQGRRHRAQQEPRARGRAPRHPAQRGLPRHDHSRVRRGHRRAQHVGGRTPTAPSARRRCRRGSPRPTRSAASARRRTWRRRVLFLASDAASFITGPDAQRERRLHHDVSGQTGDHPMDLATVTFAIDGGHRARRPQPP